MGRDFPLRSRMRAITLEVTLRAVSGVQEEGRAVWHSAGAIALDDDLNILRRVNVGGTRQADLYPLESII
ncbi:MAG: SDR family oxidoreductase [Actinomycetota bacterium]|nr:SDR family oxidoreductase [Actinomycetota bacterium]